jgi:hypothetical protein
MVVDVGFYHHSLQYSRQILEANHIFKQFASLDRLSSKLSFSNKIDAVQADCLPGRLLRAQNESDQANHGQNSTWLGS